LDKRNNQEEPHLSGEYWSVPVAIWTGGDDKSEEITHKPSQRSGKKGEEKK